MYYNYFMTYSLGRSCSGIKTAKFRSVRTELGAQNVMLFRIFWQNMNWIFKYITGYALNMQESKHGVPQVKFSHKKTLIC